VEGEPVTGGTTFDGVAEAVIEHLLSEPRDVLTILTGPEAPPLDPLLAAVEERHPELDVALHAGGQPHYLLLLSAE
jgi:fatty acid kinase